MSKYVYIKNETINSSRVILQFLLNLGRLKPSETETFESSKI